MKIPTFGLGLNRRTMNFGVLALSGLIWYFALNGGGAIANPQAQPDMVVLGYNDLGMHCMGNDFSEICILPPANTMRATVIDRTENDPKIKKSGITVSYSVPGNTYSIKKCNFWTYALPLFGVALPPNIGLAGKGMSGTMGINAIGDWVAEFVPITPLTDAGVEDPYQLCTITVKQNGVVKATTQAVMPVSWEMRCDKCHTTAGMSVASDILRKHDRMHGTDLIHQKPVLCAKCHSDNALGAPGMPGISNLSSAMHSAHANRETPTKDGVNKCYNCHPGPKTLCLRDIHAANGMNCQSCHGTMQDVGNPARNPWFEEPACGSCHHVPGHEYEEPGQLFRNSRGHRGVKCEACHGSPHVIAPSSNPRDNIQAISLQGHAGTIDTCTVCHRQQPHDPFPHRLTDD